MSLSAADTLSIRDSDGKREDIRSAQLQPLLPEIGVIGAVPDEWEGIWQTRHHILSRLSRYFNVVWYGLMRDRYSLWKSSGSECTRPRPRPAGFTVYHQDKWLPVMYRPAFLAQATERLRLSRARSIIRNAGAKQTILYLWQPRYVSMLGLIESDLAVYHIDDEYTFSDKEQPIEPTELELISRADQVFIHSAALMGKKGHLNPSTVLVPNGVDFAAYTTPTEEPPDLRLIPHPRIGYVGRIKPQLDLKLLLDLSERHKGWSFVMVGPCVSFREGDSQLTELKRRPNVYFLGNKPVEQLPSYNQHFDVCMLCYKIDDYTKYIYPLKLHEYLATGLPVVGSPILTLREFDGNIRLASTADEWSAAISASLDPESYTPSAIDNRRNVAREHDWDRIVYRIARTICERLGPPYPARFRERTEKWIYREICVD